MPDDGTQNCTTPDEIRGMFLNTMSEHTAGAGTVELADASLMTPNLPEVNA